MKEYRILEEMINLSKIHPNARNYSQLLYYFSFTLLTISLSAYNFVQSELPLPNIRSVYRKMSNILTIKPNMLTNLTFLPDILNEYKNITNSFILTKESYILAVDALSTTPFVNINKNITAIGLMTDEINPDESFLLEYSLQKFGKYIEKNSNQIINSLFVYSLQPINHDLPTFFVHILPYNSGKANNITNCRIKEIVKICKKSEINIIGVASDGDTAMNKFHDKNKNLSYFSDILHIMKRGRYAFVKMINSKSDGLNKINELNKLFDIPQEILIMLLIQKCMIH